LDPAQHKLDYVLMQNQDSRALTQASLRLNFQYSPPEEKMLSPTQFMPSGPTMAPSFTPREDSRKVRLEKTNPSKTINIGWILNQAQQDELIRFLVDNPDIFLETFRHA
jgi:hypothetical protein